MKKRGEFYYKEKYHSGKLRIVNENMKIVGNKVSVVKSLWGDRKIICRWIIIYYRISSTQFYVCSASSSWLK